MDLNISNPKEGLYSNRSQTQASNTSAPDGCLTIRLDQMEFVPWDNPKNIISADTEVFIRRIKDVYVVPLLFLIGGPANVINMAVFFKQGLKERINVCLFALSLSDELYLVESMLMYGERLPRYLASQSEYGPLTIFMINNNLIGFYGFTWTSQVLSSIIASERCLCVVRPLTFQTFLRTKTTVFIIITVCVLVVGPYFFVASRYRIGCVYNPLSDTSLYTIVESEVYNSYRNTINYLDAFVYGAGLPVISMLVVTVTTIITTVKLGEIVKWRMETSSSSLSVREVSLTRMLIGTSVLFVICVFPIALLRFAWLFLPEVTSGRRHHNFFQASLWVLGILSFINSSFNIFVYYVMGSRFRETFWSLLSKGKRTLT